MELTRAREAVERAQTEGAADFAPVDYRMARDALDRGRALIESRDNAAAQQSLQLAQARGELAASKSVGAQLRAGVAAKEAENERLRREFLNEGQVP